MRDPGRDPAEGSKGDRNAIDVGGCQLRLLVCDQPNPTQPRTCAPAYTSRACSTAAPTKLWNSGCGSKGRDFSSGWNCTPMNHGWSSYSTISGRSPSGERPENTR